MACAVSYSFLPSLASTSTASFAPSLLAPNTPVSLPSLALSLRHLSLPCSPALTLKLAVAEESIHCPAFIYFIFLLFILAVAGAGSPLLSPCYYILLQQFTCSFPPPCHFGVASSFLVFHLFYSISSSRILRAPSFASFLPLFFLRRTQKPKTQHADIHTLTPSETTYLIATIYYRQFLLLYSSYTSPVTLDNRVDSTTSEPHHIYSTTLGSYLVDISCQISC